MIEQNTTMYHIFTSKLLNKHQTPHFLPIIKITQLVQHVTIEWQFF